MGKDFNITHEAAHSITAICQKCAFLLTRTVDITYSIPLTLVGKESEQRQTGVPLPC